MGSGVITPLILTLALDVRQCSGLCPATFTPGKISSIIHWISDDGGLATGVNTLQSTILRLSVHTTATVTNEVLSTARRLGARFFDKMVYFCSQQIHSEFPPCWMGSLGFRINEPWISLLTVDERCGLWSRWVYRQYWNVKTLDYGSHEGAEEDAQGVRAAMNVSASIAAQELHMWNFTAASFVCLSFCCFVISSVMSVVTNRTVRTAVEPHDFAFWFMTVWTCKLVGWHQRFGARRTFVRNDITHIVVCTAP